MSTASASSSTFSRFTHQEFKELAIKTNQENYELISELFQTLDDIFETHVAFSKIFVVLEGQVAKREKDSKAYDDILGWKKYMKDKLENIILLSNFQLKKVRTVLRAWFDLNEIIEYSMKKAQEICRRRWYAVYNIMEMLHFPTMELIENPFPLNLMIEQVQRRCEESKENIKELDHIRIGDADQLRRKPFTMQENIHIFILLWHKLAKNEMENFRSNIQLGFEFVNYPNIEELLEIWNKWRYFLGY